MTEKVRFQARLAWIFFALVNVFNRCVNRSYPAGEWLTDAVRAVMESEGAIPWAEIAAMDDSEFASLEDKERVFAERIASDEGVNVASSVYMGEEEMRYLKEAVVAQVSDALGMSGSARPGYCAVLVLKWFALNNGKGYFVAPSDGSASE